MSWQIREMPMPLDLRRVDSIRSAAELLADDPTARFLAGGTILMRLVNYDAGALQRLVLSDGLGLDRIEIASGRATIGAAVTMAAIGADARLAFLKPVADGIGGPAIRNMATVGGNLFARSPYGDLAVALLALGATATVEAADRVATIDLSELLAARVRREPRIVTSVSFDLPGPGAFRFAKAIRRKPHGAAVLSIAALLPEVAGSLRGVRIAYGAMAPGPIRVAKVERALEGRTLDEAAIEAAGKVAAEGCEPADDAIASAWYRRSVVAVHLRRLLAEGR
jgi:CO/xanthine dehydrogenase FAD-binding subunit